MTRPAMPVPQFVLNFKLGNSKGQLEEELDVLFRYEYTHYPENVCIVLLKSSEAHTARQLLNERWALKGRNNKPERLAPPLLDFIINRARYDCNVLVTIDTHADVNTGQLVYAGRGEDTSSATVDDVRIRLLSLYITLTSYRFSRAFAERIS
jgi:hypothetical protein